METLSAYLRSTSAAPMRLEQPVRTDLFGTDVRYYAIIDGHAVVATGVRPLAKLLGKATLNPGALLQSLSQGLVLRDETVLREVRSIPPHSTLHPDGSLTEQEGPRAEPRLSDAAEAVRRLRGLLADVLASLEPRFREHLAGFTGGRDSRILAALPKGRPGAWRWLSVSGQGDAEHLGAQLYAGKLGLRLEWTEWTRAFLEGGVHRVSAELASGVGAISDYTLLRSAFEPRDAPTAALWIGTLADALIAGTFLAPAANLHEALSPRTAHLARVLAQPLLEELPAQLDWLRAQHGDPRVLRLLSRGRAFVCKALASLDRVCETQVNPYLHESIVELGLQLDPRLLASDALRTGLLQELGPGLDGPSAFGYRAPAYGLLVLRALQAEARLCQPLERVLQPALLDSIRAGSFPELSTEGPVSTYRIHDESQPVLRSLRDYEHLLTYATFLNLLSEDGVAIG